MRRILFSLFALLAAVAMQAQYQTATKNYKSGTKAGEVYLLYTYGEYSSGTSVKHFTIDVPKYNNYYIYTLSNLREGEKVKVNVDNMYHTMMYSSTAGWQYANVSTPVALQPGKHTISFVANGEMVPMIEEFAISTSAGREVPVQAAQFLSQVEYHNSLARQSFPTVAEAGDLTNKVLPNPQGMYDHAIDTTFNYSHWSWIYLNVGYHNFSTINSTVNRSLTIFNPTNYTYSWSNVNGGPGGESALNLYVGLAGYYAITLRPYTTGSGVTDIIYNGSVLVNDAIVGGRTYTMSASKGGALNFFTCRLTGGDTRMIATKYFASSVRGYNDDYSGGGGDWSWGYASRIKKDFGTDSVAYGFVCAYGPYTTGSSDVYLGNGNSPVHNTNYPEFPLLKSDDAILASNTGYYNCISWSGGVTSSWIWPPSAYSTYNCPGNDMNVTCFDNFYGNSPVRYPGAWTYTRTGATVNNAVVDLWALNGHYTHGSVRKPGNNHPHGYDWESKPGGTPRTFHPRNALTNLNTGYGAVVNYYIHTGGYGRGVDAGLSFETDADAVKAGVAVFEKARLTENTSDKLKSMLRKGDASVAAEFNKLYESWKQTWTANAIYSDPAMYCKNVQHEAMAAFAKKNPHAVMLLVFDKFVNENDHLIGELMWTLTNAKYAKLLDEVKTERARNPNDASGRYKIHGDHDNGVLYVEKILQQLEEEAPVIPVSETVNVVVSPNPVKDRLTVQLTTTRSARISVQAVSGQTRQTRVMQPETTLAAGTHRFNMDISGFAGATGDIIAVQVMIDGVMKTIKVLVTK